MLQEEVHKILGKMTPITLKEMKTIRLMDRIDSKYVASDSLLPQLLEDILPYYRVQVNNNNRISPYCTQYLDTPDLDMFVMHQNGKLNRQKIRIRSYMDSEISFLEVKNKNNKGRTSKIRVPVNQSHIDSIEDLEQDQSFLEKNSMFDSSRLEPTLANNFQRITLVDNNKTERVTIDLNLSFRNYKTGEEQMLENVMILELKQEGGGHSHFRDALNHLRIKQLSFSKYCIGTVLTNANVKANRFKRKCSLINKLIQQNTL
ncbi:VTC domain-containing protein [Bacteroidia bacterium]|nr:VTC domain-containing protein [Bacteroidia bacterium]